MKEYREIDNIITKALAARAKRPGLQSNDVDVALGWLIALSKLKEEGKIPEAVCDELRELSADAANAICVRRLQLEGKKPVKSRFSFNFAGVEAAND